MTAPGAPAAPGGPAGPGGPAEPADLIIRDGVILTLDAQDRVIHGDVAVRDGRIVAMGPDLAAARTGSSTKVVDAGGGVVLPGLVNAHMHECMERGVFEDLPFMRWLNEFALPKDRCYQPRHLRAAALMNQLEMIQNGTTTFIDIFRYPATAAEVALQSGLRATFSPQVIDTPQGVGESLDENIQFVDDWHDREPERIRTWFGPHSLYSVDAATYERMAELAERYRVGIHTHLAESSDEVAIIAARTGLTPVGYLDRLIGLGPHVLAAHCVHLTDDDVDLIAARGMAVAHCPTSNMKLGNGVARVPTLIDAGIAVGLGTDSVMTNNNLDMFEEMRQAALVQKLVTGDAGVLPCRQVLHMATMGSAHALGLADQIGSLEVGKRADLIVVDLDHSHLWPVFTQSGGNVAEQLVYAANGGDVRTTIVGGQVLMDYRVVATIDATEVRELVGREAEDLLARAGVFHQIFERSRL
jgi:5-methylthioadenosine/S-adenosylhomocysteine deaminase